MLFKQDLRKLLSTQSRALATSEENKPRLGSCQFNIDPTSQQQSRYPGASMFVSEETTARTTI